MATLWITEHKNYTPKSDGGPVPVPNLGSETTQTLTTSGTAASATALAAGTVMVELYCDTAVHITSANPVDTADTSDNTSLGLLVEEARTNLCLQSEDKGRPCTIPPGTARETL